MVENKIYVGDCLRIMKRMDRGVIDMVVTSPPYGNMKTYAAGNTFDFKAVARELYRIVKPGGVIAWNICDQYFEGSESGESFRQALFFMDIGFRLNDTMIWDKQSFGQDAGSFKKRYGQIFEYVFIFTKGPAKTFNPIKDRVNQTRGSKISGLITDPNGKKRQKFGMGNVIAPMGQRFNVWRIPPVSGNKTCHPAVFPVELARDLILSWSAEGDMIYDPFIGSGTTAVAALSVNRGYIGSDTSMIYVDGANKRIKQQIKEKNYDKNG